MLKATAKEDLAAALQTLTRWCDGGYTDEVSEAIDLEAARKGLERVRRRYSEEPR